MSDCGYYFVLGLSQDPLHTTFLSVALMYCWLHYNTLSRKKGERERKMKREREIKREREK
jgi:hypothetical protein